MTNRKFSLAEFGNNIMERSIDTGLLVAGMAASRKFIDADKIIKNPTNNFTKGLSNNQGIIKFLLGLGLSGTSQNIFVKNLAMGMALEGGFTALRKFTSKKVGETTEYFIEQIGETETTQQTSSVAGDSDDGIEMAVSGMGAEDDLIDEL